MSMRLWKKVQEMLREVASSDYLTSSPTKVFLDDLLPARQSVATTHGEIMADRLAESRRGAQTSK
jgi:hypothetical protein